MAVDIGVSSVTRLSIVKKAAVARGAAADDYGKAKVAYYRADCEARGFKFIPLVVEGTGGWLKESKAFLNDLAGLMASAKGLCIEDAKCRLYRTLSSCLQHGNVRCLLHHHTF